MSKEIRIYELIDPISLEPRYIGITSKTLEDRLKGHIRNCKKKNTHKTSWIKKLLKYNIKPIIKEIDIVNENEWQFWEKHYISLYKTWGFNLTNSDEGGQGTRGYKHTSKTKKILRTINYPKGENHYLYGKKMSEENKNKLRGPRPHMTGESNPMYGKESPFKGKKHSEYSKNKISIANKGSNHYLKGENHPMYGKKHTDDTKLKIKLNTTRLKGENHPMYGKIGNGSKSIIMLDLNDNKIGEFNSLHEAYIKTGVHRSAIRKVCNGNRKKAGGYKWSWKNNKII